MTERDPALDPAEMLAMAQRQQRRVTAHRGALVPAMLFVWGAAWFVGFGALWLGTSALSGVTATLIAIAAALVAGVITTVLAMRSARGVRGGGRDAAFAGIVYGQMWWVALLAVFAIGQAALRAGMDGAYLLLLYPPLYLLVTGMMFVMGGLIWKATPMLVLGGVAVILAGAAPFAGASAQLLVIALVGGGALFATGVWTLVWVRRGSLPVDGSAA